MQAPCAGVDPAGGHRHGVVAVAGGVLHAALLEADAVAVLEIDGGNDQHVVSS